MKKHPFASRTHSTTFRWFVAALTALCASAAIASPQYPPDPGCTAGQAWIVQTNPPSDLTGKNNIDFPLGPATYWGTPFTAAAGSSVTIKGQFAAARYMSVELYDDSRTLLGSLSDVDLNPDLGQNNPYRSGSTTVQGTYTVHVIFGRQPLRPRPNTLYAGSTTSIILLYRIYYSDNPNDLTGGATSPVLPEVIVNGTALSTCPPRPIISPPTQTVWGRLDQNNFVGVAPRVSLSATNPPSWTLVATNGSTFHFPNQDNAYMSAILSRAYLAAPYNYDLVVMQMMAPTFVDTQAGVLPYANADTRMWSVCTNEPLSTGVVRCIPDDQATSVNGMVTFVVSDPSKHPAPAVLSQWGAEWIAWGALAPGDFVYGAQGNTLTNANGVYFYDTVIYRQTVADPSFIQSINNVASLAPASQQAAMGPYWPQIGYCTLSGFQTLGTACIGH
jgi:hypothetical protein